MEDGNVGGVDGHPFLQADAYHEHFGQRRTRVPWKRELHDTVAKLVCVVLVLTEVVHNVAREMLLIQKFADQTLDSVVSQARSQHQPLCNVSEAWYILKMDGLLGHWDQYVFIIVWVFIALFGFEHGFKLASPLLPSSIAS